MSFMLIMVQTPEMSKSAEGATWQSFRAYAELERLREVAGVFCINDTAWLFDTRKTLPECALVIHQAHKFHVQLFSFQLDSESLRSLVASYPRSKKMEDFLAS